jgi:hypothetical protein
MPVTVDLESMTVFVGAEIGFEGMAQFRVSLDAANWGNGISSLYPFTEFAYSTDTSCNFTNYLDMNSTSTHSWEIRTSDGMNFIGGYIYQMPVCLQNVTDAVCWLPATEI